jgi:hypothetical protein
MLTRLLEKKMEVTLKIAILRPSEIRPTVMGKSDLVLFGSMNYFTDPNLKGVVRK